MPTLVETQTRIRDAILGGGADALKGVIVDDRLGFARRVSVYRNNTTILLSEALAANFPIVHTLVGDDFFNAAAKLFVRTHPPRNPCLFAYGTDFADFLETLPSARELAYLADVARLEWAVNESLYARDADALNALDLADVAVADYARLTFAMHPATRLMASPYPIHAIWAMHQPDANDDARVNLAQGGEAVLVTRPRGEISGDVRVTKLGLAEEALCLDLSGGVPLGDAFTRAQAHHPGFDGAGALAKLLGGGAFTAFTLI